MGRGKCEFVRRRLEKAQKLAIIETEEDPSMRKGGGGTLPTRGSLSPAERLKKRRLE